VDNYELKNGFEKESQTSANYQINVWSFSKQKRGDYYHENKIRFSKGCGDGGIRADSDPTPYSDFWAHRVRAPYV
jgi:hypothetical protein